MTEKKVSYVRRLNPDRVGQLPQAGSAFAADANVPAILRGPATGFTVSALLRGMGLDYAGQSALPETELVAGSRGFTIPPQPGWLLTVDEGQIVTFLAADISVDNSAQPPPAPGSDMLVTVICDVVGDVYTMLINGQDVGTGAGATYAQGPANFGIGTSLDPTFTPATWPPADSGGVWNTGLAGLWVTPDLMTPDEYIAHYESSLEAANLVPVATGLDQTIKGAHYDARRIATLSDETTEWVDSIGGFALPRVGPAVPTGAVDGRRPNFASVS